MGGMKGGREEGRQRSSIAPRTGEAGRKGGREEGRKGGRGVVSHLVQVIARRERLRLQLENYFGQKFLPTIPEKWHSRDEVVVEVKCHLGA